MEKQALTRIVGVLLSGRGTRHIEQVPEVVKGVFQLLEKTIDVREAIFGKCDQVGM